MIALALTLAIGGAAPVVETLADGTTLLFVQMKGARQTSLRYVVRSGAADEPSGRGGLAHLLEHLVMQGTYTEPEGTIFDAVWGVGGYVNASTTADWTSYDIDVPRDAFARTAPLLLHAVSSPAIPFAALEREKGVVDAEHFDRGDPRDWLWAIDHLVFPAASAGVNVIGTQKSREAITVDELTMFVEQNYVPANSVIIVVGDLAIDDAKQVIEGALLGAPGAVGPSGADEAEEPHVPSEAKSLSWVTVTMRAHVVDEVSRDACQTAAGVAGLRLRQRLLVDEGWSAVTDAFCYSMRGHQLLVVIALTLSPESSTMPDILDEVMASCTQTAPTKAEQATVAAWARAEFVRTTSKPAALADALRWAVGPRGREVTATAKQVTTAPKLNWAAVPKVFSLAAKPERIAQLHFSRFEG